MRITFEYYIIMKNDSLFLLIVFICLGFGACSTKVEHNINRLEGIVEDVETNGKYYSSEDWENVNQDFEELTERIAESADELTPEQNRELGRLYARYHKAVAKNAIDGISDYINAATEIFNGYAEELFGSDIDDF